MFNSSKTIIVLMLCTVISLQAQTPLVQASQAVMAFHPSNAGARHAPRVSFAINFMNNDERQSSNTYFSYDQFLDKQKLGVGAYYCYSNDNVSPLEEKVWEHVPQELLSSHLITERSHTFGVSISPKLNIQQRTNYNETAFTFSPSFFISYDQINISYQKLNDKQRFTETVYSPEYPMGHFNKEDSVRTSFWKNEISARGTTGGLGFQFIAKKALFQIKLPVSWHQVIEKHAFYKYTSETNRQEHEDRIDTRSIINFNPEFNGGYSFTLSAVENLYLTVIGATAFRLYTFDSHTESNYAQGFYGEYLEERNQIGWHYAHLSTLIRKGKGLLGGGYTYLDDTTFFATTLGFQSSQVKITASMMFGRNIVLETSVGWVF